MRAGGQTLLPCCGHNLIDGGSTVSVRRRHFWGVERWKLWAAFHLIDHDAVDYLRIALCVDEELADTAVPRPDVGK